MKSRPGNGNGNGTSAATHRNIQVICELEERALERRTTAERISDVTVSYAGRMSFLIAHAIWFAVWILWNSGLVGLTPFDPFPYTALTTFVSLEAIFLTLIILMSQNRAGRRADERAHLDLQINLLAELETTTVLRLLKALCVQQGIEIGQEPELGELLQRIQPEELAKELEKSLPTDAASPPTSGSA